MAKTGRDICNAAFRRVTGDGVQYDPPAEEFAAVDFEYRALFSQLQIEERMDFSAFDADTVPDNLATYFADLVAERAAFVFRVPPPPTPYYGGLRGLRRAMFPDDRGDAQTDDEKAASEAEARASYY